MFQAAFWLRRAAKGAHRWPPPPELEASVRACIRGGFLPDDLIASLHSILATEVFDPAEGRDLARRLIEWQPGDTFELAPQPADPQLKAIDHRNPANGAPGWWGVRCPRCRAWLTRYDFTAEDSLSIARGVLASGEHRCGSKTGGA